MTIINTVTQGNRINMTTVDKTIDYTYDNLNILTESRVQGILPQQDWWIAYTYDSIGNRLSMEIDSDMPAYHGVMSIAQH